MRVPQDVVTPLAIAIRDVLWYKPKVLAFFKDCELPRQLLAEVRQQQSASIATIKIVHFVLDELEQYGDEGWVTAKPILTKMNYWKDTNSIEPERKQKALASLAAFRAVL